MTKELKSELGMVVINAAIAVVCITALMLYALYLGHDGLLLTGAIGTIAAIVGVKGGQFLQKKTPTPPTQ